jgi:hypothetical protein
MLSKLRELPGSTGPASRLRDAPPAIAAAGCGKPRISAAETECPPVLFLHYQEGRRFDIQSDAQRSWLPPKAARGSLD